MSGARSGSDDGHRFPQGELLSRGMRDQVADFTALVRAGDVRFNPATTMFFLLGGLNDGSLPAGETRSNEEALIDTLYALGARRFDVAMLPEKIPAFAAAGARANTELATLPADVAAKHPDATVHLSHWGHDFDEVLTHPAQYHLANTTDRCAGRALRNEDTTPCATPDTYFYFHSNHPSTAVHKIVGDMLYNEAVATQ